MHQKLVLVTWERILNDLSNAISMIELISEYSNLIDVELEESLHKRLKSVISRLREKKRLKNKQLQKDLEKWK